METRQRLRDRVERLSDKLGPVRLDLAVVGGTVPALYEMLGVADVRPTIDIDVIVPARSRTEWYAFTSEIEKRGFQAVTDEGVICRYRSDDLVVDMMPTAPEVLGFGSRWHEEAYSARVDAPHGGIKVIAPLHFMATKFEAFQSRGQDDPMSSPDLEDILVVFRGIPEVVGQIMDGQDAIHGFVRDAFSGLTSSPDILDLIRAHLEPDQATQSLAPAILESMQGIAGQEQS